MEKINNFFDKVWGAVGPVLTFLWKYILRWPFLVAWWILGRIAGGTRRKLEKLFTELSQYPALYIERVIIAGLFVFGAWNPTGFSLVDWFLSGVHLPDTAGMSSFEMAAGYAEAAYNSLSWFWAFVAAAYLGFTTWGLMCLRGFGLWGLVLVVGMVLAAFFAINQGLAALALAYTWFPPVDLLTGTALSWGVPVLVSMILGAGFARNPIKRRLEGTVTVDDGGDPVEVHSEN